MVEALRASIVCVAEQVAAEEVAEARPHRMRAFARVAAAALRWPLVLAAAAEEAGWQQQQCPWALTAPQVVMVLPVWASLAGLVVSQTLVRPGRRAHLRPPVSSRPTLGWQEVQLHLHLAGPSLAVMRPVAVELLRWLFAERLARTRR